MASVRFHHQRDHALMAFVVTFVKACLHLLSSVRVGPPQAPLPSVRPVVVQLNCAPRALSARRSLSLWDVLGIFGHEQSNWIYIYIHAVSILHMYIYIIYSQEFFQ